MGATTIQPQIPEAILATMASAVVAKSVSTAAAGTLDLFIVAGGRIQILELYGTPTEQVGAVSVTAKIQSTSSGGNPNDLCAAAGITSAPVGRYYGLPGNTATTMRTGSGEGGVSGLTPPNWIVPPGTIQLVLVGNSGAGAMTWTLLYVPLDVGATAVAA